MNVQGRSILYSTNMWFNIEGDDFLNILILLLFNMINAKAIRKFYKIIHISR